MSTTAATKDYLEKNDIRTLLAYVQDESEYDNYCQHVDENITSLEDMNDEEVKVLVHKLALSDCTDHVWAVAQRVRLKSNALMYSEHVAPVFSLSTAHCSVSDLIASDLTAIDTEYGVIVVLPGYLKEETDQESCDALKEDIGEGTFKMLEHAGKLGCVMVNFDCDAPKLNWGDLEDSPETEKVWIHWGTAHTRKYSNIEPTLYEFGTLAEMNAFLHGISQGDGVILDWEQYDTIEDVIAAREKKVS